MRKAMGLGAALVALAVIIGGIGAARHFGLLSGPAPAAAAGGPAATATIAPPPATVPDTAPTVVAAAPDADLPSVDVAAHIAHTVPADSEAEPAPHVTIERRDGRVVAERATPLPAPPPRATRAAADPAAVVGAARPLAGPILSVGGRTVRLFGVRAADAREHCASGSGVAASCVTAANAALAARFGGNAGVTCAMPPGQRTDDPAFICHDSAGVDLGGLLVAQGLALVDRGSSYQYLAAEDAARTAHQGLWRYR